MSSGEKSAREAAARGFPASEVLFESVRGSFGVVVLETGSAGHSYPYGTVCRQEPAGWVEVAGANAPAWYPTADGVGVIVFWEEGRSVDRPEVEYRGSRLVAESHGGYVLAVIWDAPDPGDDPERSWPRLV